MTKNKRYEAHFDALNDARILQATAQLAPRTLPQQAYGPEPIEWQRGRVPGVWAWITWRDAPATKIPAVAEGWNDRVVVVAWEATGGRRSVVLWQSRSPVARFAKRLKQFARTPLATGPDPPLVLAA